ncbi:aldo/keto reductase [Sulfuriroseicoccus oceanibius]|uniref:Aldo/keto reductase n=1 Tax=Sulfuriroseicoccus oceanibius TaxID=2707525 RepID=A0A6B3L1L1_9BACT|nr:aldo/keto reductase [Sulfuriroseicoccus oceanibius]QQL46245.1 aldo/keto reductase [Sulfuriroseicoccus oceanibius]
MNLTDIAYGTWSGGKFMHFGKPLEDERFRSVIRHAYNSGIRTFITADVYGVGRADQFLGEALEGIDRSTYCLVGTIGHDFYTGQRVGNRGYPRFTDPELRSPREYADYVKMATEKSLERCKAEKFDLLMLHNPDERGYTRTEVWEAMVKAKDAGLTDRLGIAPGPANGFTLDIVKCFEDYHEAIDWAMLILNPNEPWPGNLALPAAEKFGIDVLTRVADYGGIFWGDVKPGHEFKAGDHRTYRPEGWVEHGYAKLEKMMPIAEKHGLTPIQMATIWNLSHPAVKSVVPTFIDEAGEAKRYEDKINELAATPRDLRFSEEEVAEITRIGDNTGCMDLKGASKRHETSTRPDEWPMRDDLVDIADRYNLGQSW